MNCKDIKQTGLAAWQVLAGVLSRHGDGEGFARFMQGAFTGQYVRAWMRQPESEDYRESGRISPLERVDNIIDYVKLRDGGSSDKAQPIAHHVAQRCGGVFFPLPPAASCTDSEAVRQIGTVLRETGEVVEEFRKAWFEGKTPGCLTEKEFIRLQVEINEGLASLIALRTWAGSKVAE